MVFKGSSLCLTLFAGNAAQRLSPFFLFVFCRCFEETLYRCYKGGRAKTTMNIHVAATDAEIIACYPVMRELRPHIAKEQFLSRVRDQERWGYRLAFIQEPTGVVAVAGFRVGENLAWGRFLYVDDLVTLPGHRSRGHGARLLAWLRERAALEGCEQIHLDSGTQRKDAHRFYEREGMTVASLHFVEKIAPAQAPQSASSLTGRRG
jgi:GNAT superfamily N-acetyltransferase